MLASVTGPRQFGSLLLGIGDSELAVTDTIWLSFLSKLAGSIIQDCAVSTILIEGVHDGGRNR